MLRISVTDLESLRYFKNSDDRSLEHLLADLAHVAKPTREMMAGRAMAKFFEEARECEMDSAIVDGWTLNFDLDAAIDLPPVREFKVVENISTSSGPVALVGKVDSWSGKKVRDQKLTGRWDAEKYTDSLQWRSYLMMLDARSFTYDVFVGDVSEDDNIITVREYHPMTFYSYPGMRLDVVRAVNELAEVLTLYADKIAAIRERAME